MSAAICPARTSSTSTATWPRRPRPTRVGTRCRVPRRSPTRSAGSASTTHDPSSRTTTPAGRPRPDCGGFSGASASPWLCSTEGWPVGATGFRSRFPNRSRWRGRRGRGRSRTLSMPTRLHRRLPDTSPSSTHGPLSGTAWATRRSIHAPVTSPERAMRRGRTTSIPRRVGSFRRPCSRRAIALSGSRRGSDDRVLRFGCHRLPRSARLGGRGLHLDVSLSGFVVGVGIRP